MRVHPFAEGGRAPSHLAGDWSRCWVCAGETHGRGSPIADWDGANFTGQTRVRYPRGQAICEPCLWVMARNSDVPGLTGNWRNYSVLYAEGEPLTIKSRATSPRCSRGSDAHTARPGSRRSRTAVKHVVPLRADQRRGARAGALRRGAHRGSARLRGWRIVDDLAALLTAGATKDEVERGEYAGALSRCVSQRSARSSARTDTCVGADGSRSWCSSQRDEAEVAARLGREASARAEKKRARRKRRKPRVRLAHEARKGEGDKRGAKRGDEGSPLGCDGGRGDGAAPPVPRWGANALKHWDQISDRMRARRRGRARPGGGSRSCAGTSRSRPRPAALFGGGDADGDGAPQPRRASAWLALAEREYAYMIARARRLAEERRAEKLAEQMKRTPVSGRIIEKHIIEFVLEAEQPIKPVGVLREQRDHRVAQDPPGRREHRARADDLRRRHAPRAARCERVDPYCTRPTARRARSSRRRRCGCSSRAEWSQDRAMRERPHGRVPQDDRDGAAQLAFLGGCAENRTIPARSPWTTRPSCAPRARFLPSGRARTPRRWGRAHEATYRESIEEVQRVRMDRRSARTCGGCSTRATRT